MTTTAAEPAGPLGAAAEAAGKAAGGGDYGQYLEVALAAAREAGAIIKEAWNQPKRVEEKKGGRGGAGRAAGRAGLGLGTPSLLHSSALRCPWLPRRPRPASHPGPAPICPLRARSPRASKRAAAALCRAPPRSAWRRRV